MDRKTTISRRDILALGGSAASVGLLGGCGTPRAATEIPARQIGSVRIRDVLSASIQDEYVCNLIKVTTDSGLYGIGEARPKIGVTKQVGRYKPLIVGEDPLRVDYLTRKMMKAAGRPGRNELGVIAGIETALWDLAGKILNTPTCNLLGGRFRDKVKVYYDLSPADSPKTTAPGPWVQRARAAKEAGFKAMKFDIYRGGGDVPQWVQILKAIRAEVGPDVAIGVDFHWRLSPAQTDRFIELIEPVDLWFIEDPMKYGKNVAHYQRIAAEGKMPVVALEQMLTRKSFHNYIDKRICNIIEPDGQYCGGLLELKRAADLGELYGMSTLCHNMCTPVGTYAQAHACATIHSFAAMENACADDVIQRDGSLYEDGYLKLNDKPGFGIELNEDYCRKHLAGGSGFFGE